MRISIIAAVAENGVIGRGGELPWHLSADLQRFKQLTMGHTIIMGRRDVGVDRPAAAGAADDRRHAAAGLSHRRRRRCRSRQVSTTRLRLAAAAGDDEAFIIGGARALSRTRCRRPIGCT